MKKEMSREVLKFASMEIPDSLFIDIDLSACHAHIAASLQNNKSSLLTAAVTQAAQFWNNLAAEYTQRLHKQDINISESAVRSILKVSFYTSLNGGNPFNSNRLGANLKMNAPDILLPYPSLDSFEKSDLFKKLSSLLTDLELITEVKELNKLCAYNNITYTIDRGKPYPIDSQHKGISRVLQGVEVVLLSLLVGFIKQRGGLPVNLAHDGTLVMLRGDIGPIKLCEELTEDLKEWSHFLLQGLEIGVEPKIFVKNGELIKT